MGEVCQCKAGTWNAFANKITKLVKRTLQWLYQWGSEYKIWGAWHQQRSCKKTSKNENRKLPLWIYLILCGSWIWSLDKTKGLGPYSSAVVDRVTWGRPNSRGLTSTEQISVCFAAAEPTLPGRSTLLPQTQNCKKQLSGAKHIMQQKITQMSILSASQTDMNFTLPVNGSAPGIALDPDEEPGT